MRAERAYDITSVARVEKALDSYYVKKALEEIQNAAECGLMEVDVYDDPKVREVLCSLGYFVAEGRKVRSDVYMKVSWEDPEPIQVLTQKEEKRIAGRTVKQCIDLLTGMLGCNYADEIGSITYQKEGRYLIRDEAIRMLEKFADKVNRRAR